MDYLGQRFTDYAPRAVTLTDVHYEIGDTSEQARTLRYLAEIGNPQDITPRMITVDGIHYGEEE